MDIYSGRYYFINKTLLSFFGIWPYDSYRKKIIQRIFISLLMAMITLPQIFRIYFNFGMRNVDVLIEHLAILVYICATYLKFIASVYSENELKILYENIAQNWIMIKDKHERNFLIEYSERGRMLTVGYIIYMYCAAITFCIFPLAPIILNELKPLNISRPRIFVFGGEFFIDRHEHFKKIYVFDCASCLLATVIMTAVDSMYTSSIEHCLGLFAVIKFRLREATKFITTKGANDNLLHKDGTDNYIVQTIELHKKVIKFTDILESSYSLLFIMIMGLNTLMMSFEMVLALIRLDQALELTRFSVIVLGTIIHLFYLSWPGQKLITCSIGLFHDAYSNEWYDIPVKAQRLLGFITLRCSRPCQLTAGGIYVMSFTNFAAIVKTSLSYMTLFASLR